METFHAKCENQGPTLTVIRTKQGYIFGGYAPDSWESGDMLWKANPNTFIFTLVNPNGIPPTKYPLKAGILKVFFLNLALLTHNPR